MRGVVIVAAAASSALILVAIGATSCSSCPDIFCGPPQAVIRSGAGNLRSASGCGGALSCAGYPCAELDLALPDGGECDITVEFLGQTPPSVVHVDAFSTVPTCGQVCFKQDFEFFADASVGAGPPIFAWDGGLADADAD